MKRLFFIVLLICAFPRAARAGITLVQHTSKDAGTTTSSTLAFTSNNMAGNWIGVCIQAGVSGETFTVTDSKGNTYHRALQFNETGSGNTLGIYYAENIAGGANTVEVSDTTSAALRFAILEYSGIAKSDSLDTDETAQGNSTSPNSGNTTTTASGDLLLGAILTGSGKTFTAGSGYTIRESIPAAPNTRLIAEDQIQVNAGTASASATLSASTNWGAGLAAFKPARTIPLVQHASEDAATTTSASLAFPSANTAGNWIGVCIRGGNSSSQVFTVTDSKGNTYRQAKQIGFTASAVTLAIYYAENILSGANTVTVSMTVSGPLRFDILEYSGLATSSSLDVTAGVTGTSTSPNSGNATTTANGDLLLGAIATTNSATFTVGTGYSADDFVPAEPNTKLLAEDQAQAAAGAASASASIDATDTWGAVLAAFKLASGGGTAPSITSLSPTSGPVNTSVTITGTNFGSTQGTSTVTFNGTSATPTSWSATSIVVPVPKTATTGNVVVTVGGLASNGLNFTVAPAITGLSPSSGPPGTSVTISGTTFGDSQGTSTVTFNGTTASATSWKAGSIVATVPNGATTGNVVVTVSGQASGGVTFTISPYIATLSATTGTVGTSITITGSGFGATQGTSTVTFNGTAATPSSWGATSIAVPVPSAATSGSVVVNVSSVASNGAQFVVTPSISSLSPTQGTAGTAVTIAGTGFGATQGSSTVSFNGTSATPTSWSASSIAVAVPTGATTGNVVVTVASATSNGVSFTVGGSPAPIISSISPTSGSVGAAVTISGSNFGATQGTVQFNGTSATITSWGTSSIGARVPSGATSGNVVVTTASGVVSNPAGSSFIVQLQISTVVPDPAPIGSTITINGQGFGNTQGSSTVTIGSMTVSPSSWNNAQIQIPITSATTSGNVVVTVSGVASNPVLFAVGSSPGQFVSTQSMSTARMLHTATLLNNGNVLVAGGASAASSAIASSELYSSAAGTFTTSGNLITAREYHTATLLATGKVLVAGGFNGTGITYASAELYDSTAGTFTSTAGSLNNARYNHVAVLLTNGQVLLAGGFVNGTASATAELYNPATGTFTLTNSMNAARTNFSATLLNNGMVLVVGGNNSGPSAELYNPSTGNFTATAGSLNFPRGNHSATLLNNGKVLIAGGIGSNGSVLGSAELFDPGTGLFTNTGNLAVAVYNHTATLLNNGQVLIAGGFGNGFTVPTAELYDPASATFIQTGNLNAERFDHTATLLSNGNVLVAGGDVPVYVGPLASAELYETLAPIITGLSPTSGVAGTSVTITGTNFGPSQGTSTIIFNGTTSAAASSWSATSVTVNVPTGASTGNVIVTVGGQSSNGVLFVVGTGGPAPPTNLAASAASSSEIDLTWGASTTTGVAYIVFRNGFSIAANVTSTVYADFGVVPGATYVYEVEAVGPTGTSVPSNTASATALGASAPTIASISPVGGPGGTLVTINGTNFGSVPATVLFGSAFAQVQSWAPNVIVTKVPTSLLPGLANIQVVLPNGSSNAAAFQVTAAGCPGN